MSTSRDGVICVRCEVHHITQSERRVGPAKLESWRDFPDRGRVQTVGTHVMKVSENFSRYLGTAALRIRKREFMRATRTEEKKGSNDDGLWHCENHSWLCAISSLVRCKSTNSDGRSRCSNLFFLFLRGFTGVYSE